MGNKASKKLKSVFTDKRKELDKHKVTKESKNLKLYDCPLFFGRDRYHVISSIPKQVSIKIHSKIPNGVVEEASISTNYKDSYYITNYKGETQYWKRGKLVFRNQIQKKYESSIYLNGFWFILIWQDGVYIAGRTPIKWLDHKCYGKTTLKVNRKHGHLILNNDDKGFRIINVGQNGEKIEEKNHEVIDTYDDYIIDYEWIGDNKIAFVSYRKGIQIFEYFFSKKIKNGDKSKLCYLTFFLVIAYDEEIFFNQNWHLKVKFHRFCYCQKKDMFAVETLENTGEFSIRFYFYDRKVNKIFLKTKILGKIRFSVYLPFVFSGMKANMMFISSVEVENQKIFCTYVYDFSKNEARELKHLRKKLPKGVKKIKNLLFFRGELLGLWTKEKIRRENGFVREKKYETSLIRIRYLH